MKLKETGMNKKVSSNKNLSSYTDNDLLYEEGKRDEMLGKIQIKPGKKKGELHKILKSF